MNTMDFQNELRLPNEEDRFFSFTDGQAQIKYHQVFPGIALMYEDMHCKSCTFHRKLSEDIFEIRHCREGRMEVNTKNGFFYMGPGDLSVCQPDEKHSISDYPLRHYHGITVILDAKKAPPCLSCFLEDVDVHPRCLLEKLCHGSGVFIARSMPSIAHIFEELYSVPERIRTGYLKVKVLELMLFLSGIDLQTDELAQRCFTRNQKVLAQEVSSYLHTHMEQKITLEQLTEHFHASGTQIKCSIKGVYGMPLSGVIRIQKMQSAAQLLRDTDLTILEIAGRHGYDNPSKFAKAFRETMGVTPKEYRTKPIQIETILS